MLFRTFLALLFLCKVALFAQSDDTQSSEEIIKTLSNKVWKLQKDNRLLKSGITRLSKHLESNTNLTDSLRKETEKLMRQLSENTTGLDSKINNNEEMSNLQFQDIRRLVHHKTMLGFTGISMVLLVSALLYWLIHRKRYTDKNDVLEQVRQTRADIEEELLKEFQKQTSLIETQISLINDSKPQQDRHVSVEPDHKLALKVADEITRIEGNLMLMDPKTRGLKQLQQSMVKLKDNLEANGYKIPELLGINYHIGLNLTVTNHLQDDTLSKGLEIISKVIKPQVNYNEIMIQSAQVVVSQGV
jgi:hypothetical protein